MKQKGSETRRSVWRDSKTHSEEHVDHILLHSLLVGDGSESFPDGHALSSEDSLVDSEGRGGERDQPTVGGDLVSNRNGDDVSRDEGGSVDFADSGGPEDSSLIRGVLFEGLSGRAGSKEGGRRGDGVRSKSELSFPSSLH